MKTLYLECNMGAAGDMLMAALLELHPNPQDFIARLNKIGIPHTRITAVPSVKCGISGTHVNVTINGTEEMSEDVHHHHEHEHSHEHEHHHEHEHSHTHSHASVHETEHLISHLDINENVRKNANAVYALIAQAESHAHGVPVDEIHFHEVGEKDAIADIVGVCMLMDELAVDEIIASPVHVGSGQVKCAHGIMPVPAPATAYILKDVPMYGGEIRGELCTPTGAALLKHFAKSFGSMPVIKPIATGYGMGNKDFEAANCIRAILGITSTDESINSKNDVFELSCNIDDMTPEELSYAKDKLMQDGALDVYTIPISMKKGRDAHMLCVLCAKEDKEKTVQMIFKHTTTIGIRESEMKRYVLNREKVELDTKYGKLAAKRSAGYGTEKIKPEYDELARLADENDCSLFDVNPFR